MPDKGCSRAVISNQQGVHESLLAVVEKHRAYPFQKPFADFNRQAFATAEAAWQAHGGPLILDSCCGVGASTRTLARQFPEHFVLGVDRSADRLQRNLGELPENAFLVRADLADFWRLAEAAGWQPEYHFLLYPNPCPKKKDLKQRWHGHPVFPSLVALGGLLESRSNWLLYLQEMQQALQVFGIAAEIKPLVTDDPLTPFERKYSLSGQALWLLQANLNQLATG
ncbi:SAM-dependent methyltransferase [Marinospirillum sp.]|uniref:tRNA (guanine(46)-N(7))-methyltransferase TrmB n=1 Tax=Marinospirillum sp. TaxID=2183934 RepID=UPI00286FE938|nr:SAM-dependent methyltransferase [Marinospirillum sp.]MDR9466849.1 SAM-dependent methyltransferase [Marinospirillum sp.]